MTWTEDQSQVIESRRENLLVSAAAGSGKTAVLVARLIGWILDPRDPADIDEFLVVTFTRAAAAEMKERVGLRILEELEKDPGNAHLRRQLTLVDRAKITTIDGFCSWVARSYAPMIGIDMSFRVANNGELKLMQTDVMRQVMEAAHEEAAAGGAFAEAFRAFIETFATGKDEKGVEELIRQVYETAMSLPYPEDYYALCRGSAAISSIDELGREPWMADYWLAIDADIGEGASVAHACLELLGNEGAPPAYAAAITAYAELFDKLKALGHRYGELFETVRSAEIPRVSSAKGKAEIPELREQVKAGKAQLDTIRKHLTTEAFPYAPDLAFKTMQAAEGPLAMLVTMAERYSEAYTEAKRRRNIVDFSDLEHLALQVLRQDRLRTAAAKELAAGFKEVMIDEYQDSNYLQEEILTAVSTLEDGVDNYFCVGDVKQSIYSFRQARPDLFMKKYRSYTLRGQTEDAPADGAAGADTARTAGGRRIDLHRNFRSRPEILEGVNAIFRRIMRREVGDIDYDDAAALMTGTADAALIGRDGNEASHTVEVLTLFTNEEDEDGAQILEETGKNAQIALEGRAVAGRIKELVGNKQIRDAEGHVRPVEYRDIVLLLRTVDGVAEGFKKELQAADIPVVLQEKKGFFESPEVKALLSFLQVLDNPRQDIPLAAAMKSVIGGFTAEELAEIRSGVPADSLNNFIDYVTLYSRLGDQSGLKEKCGSFLEKVSDYQKRAAYTPIHELMTAVLRETGLGDFAAALPNGQQRLANLRILVENAVAYAETSYVGLFNFVRYITNLENQKEELEVASLGESENAVRIVSIHRSKGLEYPIVFVCQLGAGINLTDLKKSVLMDPRCGLASDYVDFEHRITYPTIKKAAFKQKGTVDAIGEELRVLYVALTRAKLKLYLVGSVKDPETLEKYREIRPERETGFLPAGYLAKAKKRWDLLMPAILDGAEETSSLVLDQIFPTDLIENEAAEAKRQSGRLDQILAYDEGTVLDADLRHALEERFGYHYPYSDRQAIPAKISVSEIKAAHMEMGDESGLTPFEEADVIPLVPAFMQEKDAEAGQDAAAGQTSPEDTETNRGQLSGAAIGTAYHALLARLDFTASDVTTKEGVRRQIEECVKRGILDEKAGEAINIWRLVTLINSPIGRRLASAQSAGTLKREQPFTMRVPASRVRSEWPEDEECLIQGIIDAYFEEDGKIVVVDYKTDSIASDQELIDRYSIQLELYAEALARATEKQVEERYLYSLSLGKQIAL